MKLVFIFYLLFFSLRAEAWRMPWEREDPGPLREIMIWGSYNSGDKRDEREMIEYLKELHGIEDLEELEEYYRRTGYLEEDETIKDRISDRRKDRFGYAGIAYCHKKVPERQRVYKFTVDPKLRDPNRSTPDLRARLYDGRGNFLSEAPLRSLHYYEPYSNTWSVKAYIPYHPEARRLIVVRLEGNKEINLEKEEVDDRLYTLEELQSGRTTAVYDNGSDCYVF